MIAGLVFAGATAGYAQNVPVAAKINRIPANRTSQQPVAASSVIMSSQGALNLSADQRAKVTTLNNEVAALQSERAKLWSEYRSITTAANYSDEIAESQAAPRMARILAINSQLSAIVAKQDRQLSTILTPSQRDAVAKMVVTAKAGL
jgi:hypothetical protein